MATKEKTVTVHLCDACGAEASYPYPCLDCGRVYCYECRKKCGIEYQHAAWASGSGDGFYCHACDRISTTPIHAAYVAISRLREEAKAFNAQFEIRAKAAEAALKELQPR